jgi:hypothetical protein
VKARERSTVAIDPVQDHPQSTVPAGIAVRMPKARSELLGIRSTARSAIPSCPVRVSAAATRVELRATLPVREMPKTDVGVLVDTTSRTPEAFEVAAPAGAVTRAVVTTSPVKAAAARVRIPRLLMPSACAAYPTLTRG